MPDDHPRRPGPELPVAPDSGDPYSRIAPFYDALMSSIPYEEWVEYVERVMQDAGRSPRTVLDLACGTGTVSILLAKRGYMVTGVDRSAAMLEVARRKAEQSGVDVSFLCQDACQLQIKQRFDLCICLYDSLNYVLDDDALLAVFRGVRRCLVPGGAFLFDLNSLYSFQQELFTQQSEADAEVGYNWVSRFDPCSRIADVQMHFAPPGAEPFDVIHRERAYLVEETLALLRVARLLPIQAYDAYSLLPPGRHSERIFYLAEKSARQRATPSARRGVSPDASSP